MAKLKPYITCLTLLFAMGTYICHAQCPSNKGQLDIGGSYGFITSGQLADQATANDNAAAGRGGKSQTYNSGTMFATVRYFFFNRLAFGFTGGMSNERGQNTDRSTPSRINSTYTESVITIAPEIYYIYAFRKYLEVYTLLGVGPAFYSTTTTTNATPYQPESVAVEKRDALRLQYTPLGIRVGGRIGGFAEVGIGYKGIVCAGLSFKIGPSCWWRGRH